MTSIIIIAAFAVALLVLLLLGSILGSLLELEKLLTHIEDETQTVKKGSQSPRPWFSRPASEVSDEEDRKIIEQRRWDEGVTNLLNYMGQIKGGD